MTDPRPLLLMQGISKTFPGVRALKNVDFDLRRGEVHALMGENGAGKSTLIKVLTGVEHPEAGAILLDGQPAQARSPQHAQELGISTVYQEVNLCPNLSVAENIFIGREARGRAGLIRWGEVETRARAILREQMDVNVDVSQTLGSFPVAMQQMVAIARALNVPATRVLILDEPTSSLDETEVQRLFAVMRALRDQGLGVIFITHFIDQVYEVADRITVLRNGERVGTYDTAALSRMALVSRMIGKELEDLERVSQAKRNLDQGEVALQAENLGQHGSVREVNLSVRAGEVVGLAGLLGSGRTETAQLLFGISQPDTGSIRVRGRAFSALSPRKSLALGLGMCPENRKADGIIDGLTVRENIILALQAGRGWFRYLTTRQQNEIAGRYIKALNISTPSADQLVRNLSGGNQQKVILARWLATNPGILILDEPTRGIDIGAKTEIQKLVLSLAGQGKAIIFISSELDEVIRCSHRVVVLRDRQQVGELAGDSLDEAHILETIAGGAA